MISPRTMPGVLELLPREQLIFQSMLDTIRTGFEQFGFVPVETPAIEMTDVLLTKTGGETERQVYFVQSTGSLEQGETPELALRFDLTVPLARYVAEHEQELNFPFRRYQIQRVYRGESPQKGRFREFYQCDIDVIGRDSLDLRHDAEVAAVMVDVFERLKIGDFTVRLSNRRLMRGFLEANGVTGESEQAVALREIDKLAKKGPTAVSEALGRQGIPVSAVARIIEVVQMRSESLDDALSLLSQVDEDNELIRAGKAELAEVVGVLAALRVPPHRIVIDLSIARGLDYYTGTVYETTLDENPQIGSICSGGRYDDLASHYTKSRLPGVGLSIGFTRLFWQLRELGLLQDSASVADAVVTLLDDEGLEFCLNLAAGLRAAGLRVESVMTASKLGKQLKGADRSGIRFALIAGPEERSRGVVAVRDLSNQQQNEVAEDQLAAYLREN